MIKEENLFNEETGSLSGLNHHSRTCSPINQHQSRNEHRSRSNNSSILSNRTLTSSSSDGCLSRSQSPDNHLPLDSADEIDIGISIFVILVFKFI